VEELKRHIRDYGVQQVIFTDESFSHRKSLVRGFCEGLLSAGLGGRVRMICESRVTVDEETLRLMARAGFTHVTFGIESGDQSILDRAAKGIRLEQSRAAVIAAKRAGLVVDANFVLGLPWETEDTIRRTIDFACSLPLDYASLFLLTAYPGSRVHEMAARGDGNLRLLSERWEDYGNQAGGSVELTTVSRRRIEQLQFEGYLRFYGRPDRWISVFRRVSPATVMAYLAMRARSRFGLHTTG
jgi:radical SAM superfamily enzyme YgiQ (UPF0313 family)